MPETKVVITASFIYTIFCITSFENGQNSVETTFLGRTTATFDLFKNTRISISQNKVQLSCLKNFLKLEDIDKSRGLI